MSTPSIRINQTGQPAGVTGESRDNIVIGSELQVTDTANGGGSFSWTYVGPSDSLASVTGLGTNDVRVTPDVAGTYLFFLDHDSGELSYQENVIGELTTVQGGASVLLPDGRRIPGEGETEQFGGWHTAIEQSAKKIIRLREDGVTVAGGPFTELDFKSLGGGQVIVNSTISGTATVTVSGGGESAPSLQTTGSPVDVSLSPPPTTGQVLTATSSVTSTWQTPSGGGGGSADELSTDTGVVTVSGSDAPTLGQVLTATSSTVATWQDVTVSGSSSTVRVPPDGDDVLVYDGVTVSGGVNLVNAGTSLSSDLLAVGSPTHNTVGQLGLGIRNHTVGDNGWEGATSTEPSDITISLWVKPETGGSSFQTLFVKRYRTGTTWTSPFMAIGLRITSANQVECYVSVGGSLSANLFLSTPGAWQGKIPNSIWSHVGLTFDGTTFELKGYINGENVVSDTKAGGIDYGTSGPWNVLLNGSTAVESFVGDIEDVRVAEIVRDQDWFTDVWRKGIGVG